MLFPGFTEVPLTMSESTLAGLRRKLCEENALALNHWDPQTKDMDE